MVEVEDWNEYGELKQHIKIVGTHNLVAPAKPYTKPGQSPPSGNSSAAALAHASQAAKASTPAPAPRGEMKNAPPVMNEAQQGIANAMRGMALEASQKAQQLKKAATIVATGASKAVADAVNTATKQATDADLENAHRNVNEEIERIKEKGYKEEAPLISHEADGALTGAGAAADNAQKAAIEEARAADKENAHRNVEEEKEKREQFGYVAPSTSLTQEAEELKTKTEEVVLGGGAAESDAKDIAVKQATDADRENAYKNVEEEKKKIREKGYVKEGEAELADTKAINEHASLQSPASTAWKPTDVDPPVRTHRGSEVEQASLDEIRRIEKEEMIEEGIEEDDDEDNDAKIDEKTKKVVEKVADEGENVKPKRMTEME